MYKRQSKDYISLFIKGLYMGSANKVPGVSGGMIAMVTGIYEEFIYSLQKINRKALYLLWNRRFNSFFNYINIRFQLAVNLGSATAYFTVSLLLDYLIAYYPIRVWSLFFGLILGSIYYISKSVSLWNWKTMGMTALGTAVGLCISFINPLPPNDSLIFIFFCGVIGVSGMTLPGFSGSFMLMLLGNYVLLMVDSVNNLFHVITSTLQGDFSWSFDPNRIHLLQIVVVFTTGSIIGMVSFSHILGYLLKRYHNGVTALLIGFITGSLGVVWPWKTPLYKSSKSGQPLVDALGNKILITFHRFIPNELNTTTIWAGFWALVGMLLVFLIVGYETKNAKKSP